MGKNKYIETPEKMWEYFCSYRDELRENPIKIIEQKRGSVNFKVYGEADLSSIGEEIKEASNPIVELPTQRPLTFEGFQNWLDDNDIITDVTDYFENKDNRYSEYIRICSRIKRNIRQDQIEGGMAGIYNPSITQRLNNLTEKTDITTGGDKINTIPSSITVNVVMPEDE
ncbi:hypothetical protein J2X97_000319 [Epilithonimonas hungarica]|uniref:terminase small subunit n=1 Tax=Epilithonimonas hungarica TaxID=454006 RepID=UPI00278903A0|nr:terminase small subunit [Epilithonimonas hungarica]MDP9954682.1 hypothetical protein [Epilithonimonas hungarica]